MSSFLQQFMFKNKNDKKKKIKMNEISWRTCQHRSIISQINNIKILAFQNLEHFQSLHHYNRRFYLSFFSSPSYTYINNKIITLVWLSPRWRISLHRFLSRQCLIFMPAKIVRQLDGWYCYYCIQFWLSRQFCCNGKLMKRKHCFSHFSQTDVSCQP